MELSLQKSLEKAWTVITAAAWAVAGGGVGALVDALDDISKYEGPLDYAHIRKLFITGAVLGFAAWMKKQRDEQKALYTPVPGDATPVPVTVHAPAPVPIIVPVVIPLPAAAPVTAPAPAPTPIVDSTTVALSVAPTLKEADK